MYIIIKSYNKLLLNLVKNLILNNIDDKVNYISLPTKKKYFNLLKSPHIFNKSRTLFKQSIYKEIININSNNITNIIKLIENNNINGIYIEIYKILKYDKY